MEDRRYPYIGINKYTGLKIIFVSPNTGFVLEETHYYRRGFYINCWTEEDFIPENKALEKYSCVVVETIEELKELEEIEDSPYKGTFHFYYVTPDALPVIIWQHGNKSFTHTTEDYKHHRVLFKDYAIWSKDKEKAKEILNISTTVEMTLEEICKALGKNIKIVKETK